MLYQVGTNVERIPYPLVNGMLSYDKHFSQFIAEESRREVQAWEEGTSRGQDNVGGGLEEVIGEGGGDRCIMMESAVDEKDSGE